MIQQRPGTPLPRDMECFFCLGYFTHSYSGRPDVMNALLPPTGKCKTSYSLNGKWKLC